MSNTAPHAGNTPTDNPLHDAADSGEDIGRILTLARNAGMLVTLDGQIGRQKYQSVAGSLQAFRRFAQALSDTCAGAPVG
ncbi:hypothetical protein R8871_06011 [Paraburkholderia graminis C4D1M]|jgi:hypothetical protein|uniref:Uncharacterized protein n=1 Tax=Paraburkholderia graminis (strain ATCC 700544 / DSM 17151 / LMG 18924 / NCIMB 13744 / C4D1M) TaxID=396598 RepID=B1G461_PARG4|nr:hypothetical protein [Paraburkholderia graminis]EDT09134.1 conserved hypothetical protein [Paraburkholderia graminis C4D1M]CAB3734019.1 hypothetical protein R8871_06011 [Paraburkholderia graminis C4D1M]